MEGGGGVREREETCVCVTGCVHPPMPRGPAYGNVRAHVCVSMEILGD